MEKLMVRNAAFNVLYKLMNMVFPLITAVYISHILLAGGIGRVNTAQNIAQYFVLIAPLGISNYGTREIAKIRTNQTKTEKMFTELFMVNFTSTLICSSLYYLLIIFGEWFSDQRLLYMIAGIPIVFNVINVEWYYQGHEEYKYIAIRSIIVKTLSLFVMLLCVRTAKDYVIFAFVHAMGIVGNYIFNAVNLVRNGLQLNFDDFSIQQHLKPVLILFCSNIAIELYTLLDTSMLSIQCSEEIVGYYTNSIKLVRIIVGLITAIGSVLLPRLSFYKQQGMKAQCNDLISQVTMVMLFFAIPCGLGVFILADKLVLVLFGSSFISAVGTIRIASILIYVLGFSNLFGTQVLLTFNQEKKLLFCTIVGAFFNICINLVLIPRYQHNGAVIASVISETLVTILTVFYSRKYINVSVPLNFWLTSVLSAIIMALMVYCLNLIIKNQVVCLSVSIAFGAVTYFALSFITKNPITRQLKKLIPIYSKE